MKENGAVKARYGLLADKIIKNFKKRNFEAYYCEGAEEAAEKALSLIPESSSVSWGGSATLREIGLIEKVYRGGFSVIDRDKAGSAEERYEFMRRALTADVYLTSFNAISEDGVLVNIDGGGNRVAAIAFGPKSVVAVVGMNKVCKTAEDAVVRARTAAAPANMQRFSTPERRLNTPCALTGACENCVADDCICSYIAVTRMCKPKGRIKIILVGESLGF